MSSEPLDRHALGQALTRLANASASDLMPNPQRTVASAAARRIGLTGAPGAGKSTLLQALAGLGLQDHAFHKHYGVVFGAFAAMVK